jgi:hypothetical protein
MKRTEAKDIDVRVGDEVLHLAFTIAATQRL